MCTVITNWLGTSTIDLPVFSGAVLIAELMLLRPSCDPKTHLPSLQEGLFYNQMAEMVSSAVGQEAVHHVLNRLKETYEHSSSSNAKDRMERMEMAHIRLEAALEASRQWSVTSVPLLRWRSKLKRAAQECDHTLRRCRRRLQEEEEHRSSLPRRFAHAAISFVSSVVGHGGDEELGRSTIQRFERFADGASEFLRFVELGGGPPHQSMFFDGALVRNLLKGKGTNNCFVHGGQHLSFVLKPFSVADRVMEGALIFSLEDGNMPENNFILTLKLRLSETTNIVGVVVRCVELFAPHLSSTVEAVKTKLTNLPMQDLHWVPDVHSILGRDEHWDNIDTIFSIWARPDTLCCQHEDQSYSMQRYLGSSSSALSEPLLPDIYLEPVIQMYLLGHVTLPTWNNKQPRSAVVNGESRDSPYLKLGCNFWPHASTEDLPPAVGGSAIVTTNGEATQQGLYANISFGQLGDIMLPKAVDCLHGDMKATSYQALWNSKHGRAYLQAEKISWGSTSWRDDRAKRQRKKLKSWTTENSELMSSWIVHAPAQLQALAVDWMQNQSALPLLWKNSSCIYDCPIMPLSSKDLGSLARKIKSLSTFNSIWA